MMLQVSVVIPVRNEGPHIDVLLGSLDAQTFSKSNWEVYIIDGDSDDDTRQRLEEAAAKRSWLHILDNPARYVPQAMNIGIDHASGEFLVRLDAHSTYPSDYVARLVTVMETSDAANVGGRWLTLPGADTNIARAIALATSHRFGIGNAEYRLEGTGIKEVDTVPYGCYRRSMFEQIGHYDAELIRNQDDELNARLIKAGGRILLLPDLVIGYRARPDWASMMRMFYQYGLFKPLVNKKIGKATSWRQFAPPLFVLGLFMALSIGFYFGLLWPFLVILGLHLTVGALFAIRSEGHLRARLLLPLTFSLIHLSYGVGYWYGLVFMLLGKTPLRVKDSR